MSQQSLFHCHSQPCEPPILLGKDEMNLAEFPLTKLGSRDTRDVLEFTSYALDHHKRPYQQQWIVRGATGLGLPNELGDRIIPALISLNAQQKFTSRKVYFSKYQLLRLMKLDPEGQNSELLELALKQLAGITIESKRAFYDKDKQKRLTSLEAFHLIEKLWFRKHETDKTVLRAETAQGYIVWGSEIWNSLRAGYIKNLDLDFYYSLPSPLARRLYRFLDKRMHYTDTVELDVFELSGRLGQAYYNKPSAVLRKLKPALEQLIERKFLAAYAIVKKGKYTRLNLRKASAVQQKKSIQRVQTLTRLRQQYNTTSREQELWQQVITKLQPNLTPTRQAMVANLILLSVNGQRAILGAPSTFILQWFEHPKQAALKNDIMATLALYLVKNQVILEFVNLKTVSKSES